MLSALVVLASCDHQTRITKEFVWNDEVKTLTGGNLYSWLYKAPFDNEFGKGDGETFVFTNADQVFPFMGRYYNAVEELGAYYNADTVIFQEGEILFRDAV